MGEYHRQNLVYEKEDLLISGPGKYPGLQLLARGRSRRSAERTRARLKTKAAPWTCTACCREQPMTIVFYIAGAVAIVSTVLMITRLNAVHALLYLIVSLLAVAVVFYTLGAPFVAALEVIIYAGAIMVLFVFVVMMLNLGEEAARSGASTGSSHRMWTGPVILAGHPDGRVRLSAGRGLRRRAPERQ